MNVKIETFYTGGGITLAEAKLDKSRYAVVSSEAPDFIAVYLYSNGEASYLPEDMIESKHKEELSSDLKPIYEKMLAALKSA
jgi:hypothetical protein